MTKPRRVDPLNWTDPITDKNGVPTPAFMRRWQQQFQANGLLPGLVNPGDVLANIGTLPGVATDTKLTALFDYNLGKAQGDVIYRNATTWTVLSPGTAGRVLTTKGTGANPVWAPVSTGGFGFSVGGLMLDTELLGFGEWTTAQTFTNADPLTDVRSEVAATGSPVLNIETWIAGVRTVIGTITFSSTTGTVNWLSSPYTLPAKTIVELRAPTPPDATLAYVTGIVNGVAG